MGDAKAYGRVCEEAGLQYSLRAHPNIVTVLGLLRDPAAGVLGIVMERCTCSLADVLYAGKQAALVPKLSLVTKLIVAAEVRAALDHATA